MLVAKLNSICLSNPVFDTVPRTEKLDIIDYGNFHTVGVYEGETLKYAAIIELYADSVHARWVCGDFLRDINLLIAYGRSLALVLNKRFVTFRAERKYAIWLAKRFGFQQQIDHDGGKIIYRFDMNEMKVA